MKTGFIIVLSILLGVSMNAQNLLNPYITLDLEHPPGLGIKVDKVTFNTTSGECAQQVLNPVISDFVSNGVDVIDRENFNALLAEHKLSLSGHIDRTTAASIGEILGPSAIITLKVLRCETIPNNNLMNVEEYKTKSGVKAQRTVYISRMEFFLKISIQVTDLTTGRIFAAQTFDYHELKDNRSYHGQPVLPSKYLVQEVAYKAFARDVHKLFFSWKESVKLTYFNDVKCNLKEAYQLLKSGNIQAAYQKSLENVEQCLSVPEKDRFIAHAYYNVGMSHFINGEYEKAIEALLKSQRYKDNPTVKKAISNCRKAQQLASVSQQLEENMALSEELASQEAATKKREALTNEDVLKMTKEKVEKDMILLMIDSKPCNFSMNTSDLLELNKAGVDKEVIKKMMSK